MAWLVLITQQTQAAKKVLDPFYPAPEARAAPRLRLFCPVPETRIDCARRLGLRAQAVLLSSQLPSRDLACRAVLIRIADLGPKRPRLVLLAFGGIKIGKIELGH
jgi:hypothetical protein